jgi:hypothetical protein
MNMFMAIIGNSYNNVKEENANKDPEFMLSDFLKVNYSRIVDKLNVRKNRLTDMKNILEKEELKDSLKVSFDEWRKILRVIKRKNFKTRNILIKKLLNRKKDTLMLKLKQFSVNMILMVIVC